MQIEILVLDFYLHDFNVWTMPFAFLLPFHPAVLSCGSSKTSVDGYSLISNSHFSCINELVTVEV